VAYQVEISPAARRRIKKLKKAAQKRIVACIEALGGDPRPAGVKKLSGVEDLYRVREGDYRIIYQVQDEILLVLVLKVGHRRDVYKNIG
jgi:mRNA interferase RelE/StbE